MSIIDREILIRFSHFILEWYPDIKSISVFGSYMWNTQPNDLDIYLEVDGKYQKPSPDAIKMLFPRVHISFNNPRVPSVRILACRGCDNITIPDPEPQLVLIEEMACLRKQIKMLRNEVKSIHASIEIPYGYG